MSHPQEPQRQPTPSETATYAKTLHNTALVTATGRLADPTDLEFSEDHLEDHQALEAAV